MGERNDFASRSVLVTGAASGIGRSTALALSHTGAELILADLNDLSSVADEIRGTGVRIQCVKCDVANPADVTNMFATAGTLDVVVHCAGIWVEGGILDMSVDAMNRQIDVNLKGSFLVAQGAARAMAERDAADPGRIVLIASELAHRGRERMSAYCASKAGVIGLVRALSRECAPGILVNAVAPGPTDTPMLDLANLPADLLAMELDNPLKRVGQPDEIAAAILFLAGPGGTLMTGQTLCPSGGAVML